MKTVDKWAAFEAKEGYHEVERLSSSFRPEAIGAWIQRRRSSTYSPKIEIPQYCDAFSKWWTALQPDWRVHEGKIISKEVNGDWGALKRPGLNGIVSVLVALYYWGGAVAGDAESSYSSCPIQLYGLETDLHINDNQYNIALTIFFFSYSIFEVHYPLILPLHSPPDMLLL